MTYREEWEEKSFQVFTDENGVLRSGWYPTGEGTVTGNVQVDRVWGNIPMQPNDDRTDTYTSFGGGSGDVGWDSTWTISSDTLQTTPYNYTEAWQDLFDAVVRTPADSHTIATTGYSNFPGYIENYAGDGDAGLETVVPNVRGMLRVPGQNMLLAANLDYERTYVNYDLVAVSSVGKVVTVETDGNHELLPNDVVSVVYNDGDGFSGTWDDVTITSKTADQFTFELPVAPSPALGFDSTGYVYANNRFIVAQDTAAGSIVNVETIVDIRVLNYD
jgi:hypothetical protein